MADSLPAPKLAQLKQEQLLWIRNHPRPWDADAWKEYHRLFEGPVQSWLDKGYGSQFLRDSSARRIVATALHCFENQRYHLGDYVIMPNHAHVLLSPQPGCPLKKILHSWKSFTAKAIIKTCPGAPNPFWLMESYDHIVRSDRQLKHYQNYIRENPSKACLGANQWTHYEAVPPEIQEGDQSLPPAPISQPFSPED